MQLCMSCSIQSRLRHLPGHEFGAGVSSGLSDPLLHPARHAATCTDVQEEGLDALIQN